MRCVLFAQWAKICFFVKSISRKFRDIDFTKKVLAHSAILSWWMLWKKYCPPHKWLRTRTSKWLTKVRIVKIIKMSMQKKKNYAQEIHEPRWRRKKERFTLLFYLSKKELLVLPCMFHWYSWTRINDTNFHI